MNKLVRSFLLVGLLFAAPSLLGQVCGDVNGDAQLTIGDPVRLLSHISYDDGQPGDFYPDNADCDGYLGLTVGDVQALFDIMFQADDHLDCSAAGTYTFAPVETDTLFIPYLTNVPLNMGQATLTVKGSFAPSTGGFYLPLLVQGEGTGGLFSNIDTDAYQFDYFIGAALSSGWDVDTLNMFGLTTNQEALTGRHDLFDILYSRSEAGAGGIAPVPTERSPELVVAVQKNGELFTPVIVYYEAELEYATLSVSSDAAILTATTGESENEATAIDFTATEEPVTFSLAASDPWIVVDEGPHVTPTTVVITTDATLLAPGPYSGNIAVSIDSPEYAVLETSSIDVDLTVNAPGPFSRGDINCDGDVTIGDISLLVDHVFINPRPIPDCE